MHPPSAAPPREPAATGGGILLVALNARYIHAALGLRYLHANLGDLAGRAEIIEFETSARAADLVEIILAKSPRIVAIGIYIWNVSLATEVVGLVKMLAPGVTVVLGGPEVSHPPDSPPLAEMADHVITGEGENAFAALCRDLYAGARPPHLIRAVPPDLSTLAFPYRLYTDDDLSHRVIYVEASRGCPFSCEFCLSSLDDRVRVFPLAEFQTEMAALIARGARSFKFLDRTFNLDLRVGVAILRFFLENRRDDMFLHFEMIPDRFPAELREWIARFPPGSLQFEVGVQSFTPEVVARIGRRQNFAKLADNLTFLRRETGAHIHADLIFGLPGETLDEIADGFDRLWRLRPQEIQAGILKRLRGAPISRHAGAYAMVFSPQAPYELLASNTLDFATMQRLKRFARHWDMVANSGRFPQTVEMLLEHPHAASPFRNFLELSGRLHATAGRTHGISPEALGAAMFATLTAWGSEPGQVAAALAADHTAQGTRHLPAYLRADTPVPANTRSHPANRRQKRHIAPD